MLATIALLAVVQSLFGVGLLLIGTPTLLLLGVPFREALWILLPASLAVSTLQLVMDRQIDRGLLRIVAIYALPALVAGLVIATVAPLSVNMAPLVAVLLALAALIRLQPALARVVRTMAARHERFILTLIGFVHGMTNMGGSLLLDFAASRHVEKVALRQQVALGYVLFASSQLLVLIVMDGPRFNQATVLHVAITSTVFLLIGRRSFHALSQPVFSMGLSVFMLLAAGWLGWRSLGW
jgi:uncharacterized membrane protein YfcA